MLLDFHAVSIYVIHRHHNYRPSSLISKFLVVISPNACSLLVSFLKLNSIEIIKLLSYYYNLTNCITLEKDLPKMEKDVT